MNVWIYLALLSFMLATLLFQDAWLYFLAGVFVLFSIAAVRLTSTRPSAPLNPEHLFLVDPSKTDHRRVSQRAALTFPAIISIKGWMVIAPIVPELFAVDLRAPNSRLAAFLHQNVDWFVASMLLWVGSMVLQHGYWEDLYDMWLSQRKQPPK